MLHLYCNHWTKCFEAFFFYWETVFFSGGKNTGFSQNKDGQSQTVFLNKIRLKIHLPHPLGQYLQQYIRFVMKLQGFSIAALWGSADGRSGGQKQHFVCLHEVFPKLLHI